MTIVSKTKASFFFPAGLAVAAAVLLAGGTATAQTTSAARQKAALQKACANGTLSQDECAQRMAALGNQGQGQGQAAPAQGQSPQGQGQAPVPYVAGDGKIAGAREVKESHGRYTISIPEGWNVAITPDSIKISDGETWAIFETSSMSGEPMDVAHKEAAQMQAMYSNWQVFNQGNYSTHLHHPAAGMTVGATYSSKTGPKDVVMLFAAQGAGSGNFVTMTTSTDRATGQTTNGKLMQIFESIRFGGE